MVFVTNQSVNTEIKRQQKLANQIADYQQQISTGNKFDKPSDNPQDWIQISYLGRQQSLNDAWYANLTYAESRAAQAETSLKDLSVLMSNVTEQLVTATAQGKDTPGAEAVALTLQGIKDSMTAILVQTNYQGTPTFDEGVSDLVPIGQGLSYEAVGTRQSIEEGIVTDPNSTPAPTVKTIYQVLDDAIAAARSGDSVKIGKALDEARIAVDHIIVAGSKQGVRTQRLSQEVERLQDQKLNLVERRSNLEDTDLTEAVTKVQAKMVTLQAAQAVFSKINQQSLFDYLK